MIKSPVDVFVEESEIGRPVVSKEWTRGSAVLGENKSVERRGMMCFAHRLPHFVIPI